MTKCLIGSSFRGEGFVLADNHHGSSSLEPKHEQEVGPGYREPLLPKGYLTKQEPSAGVLKHTSYERHFTFKQHYSVREKKMANLWHIVIWCGNMIRYFMCLECTGGYSTSVLCLLWWQWVVHLWTSHTSLVWNLTYEQDRKLKRIQHEYADTLWLEQSSFELRGQKR